MVYIFIFPFHLGQSTRCKKRAPDTDGNNLLHNALLFGEGKHNQWDITNQMYYGFSSILSKHEGSVFFDQGQV